MDDKKKKESAFSWLMWWQVDNVELEKQVQEYKTLGIFKSKRGIAFLLELLGIASYLILFFVTGTSYMLLLTVLNAVFAILIFKGIRWAMIGMMLWSSYSTFSNIWLSYYNDTSSKSAMPWALLFWAISMHILFYAFKVEQLKHKQSKLIS